MQFSSRSIQLIFAIIIGNILEWYGFTIFVQLLPFFTLNLFHHIQPTYARLIESTLFAAGFILRPLGGLVFGHIGDRYGRIDSLTISIVSILIPTFCIGLLPMSPNTATLSIVLILVLRLLQGISAGGEFPASIAYVVEKAPPKLRGLYGSLPFTGSFIGMLLAIIVTEALFKYFSYSTFLAGAWRLPFLITIIFGAIGFYLRRKIQESKIFLSLKSHNKTLSFPLAKALQYDLRKIITSIFITAIAAATIYLMIIYMSNLLINVLHKTHTREITIVSFSLLSLTIFCPIMAILSDILGRKPVMICGCIGLILTAPTLFTLFENNLQQQIIIAELLLGLLAACVTGPLPALLAEMFATQTRSSSISISYNLAFTIFGGLSPFAAIWLTSLTHSFIGISLYIILLALASLIFLTFIQETHKRPLTDI